MRTTFSENMTPKFLVPLSSVQIILTRFLWKNLKIKEVFNMWFSMDEKIKNNETKNVYLKKAIFDSINCYNVS